MPCHVFCFLVVHSSFLDNAHQHQLYSRALTHKKVSNPAFYEIF
jgi:hypothetical protein